MAIRKNRKTSTSRKAGKKVSSPRKPHKTVENFETFDYAPADMMGAAEETAGEEIWKGTPVHPQQSYREELIRDALWGIFGSTLSTEAYQKTPGRFLRYLGEFNRQSDTSEVLGELFEGPRAEGIHGLVVQRNIPFRMCCEHHLLPAVGKAFLGYIPNTKVVGLSKLARLVDAIGTSRPSMQELLCEEIVDTLDRYTNAKGVICVIDSEHSCMACRGVNVPGVSTSTSCVRGIFRDVPAARSEFFSLIGRRE